MSNSINIRVASWKDEKEELANIRRSVFIDEQNVPEELEWDEYDSSSTHFLVTAADKPVATARLKPDGQIGRMAVLKEYRNQGIGGKLLQYVVHSTAARNMRELYLHAQVDAVAFYEKQGFAAYGDIFYEADIPHRAMSKTIC